MIGAFVLLGMVPEVLGIIYAPLGMLSGCWGSPRALDERIAL